MFGFSVYSDTDDPCNVKTYMLITTKNVREFRISRSNKKCCAF